MDAINEIRQLARSNDHLVTETLVERLPLLASLPEATLRTPEFGIPDYLVNCDSQGLPSSATPEIDHSIADLSWMVPPWIKLEGDRILILRWLAHFIGLRHHAVHLFLDPPDQADCTYVSIRSLSKYNQPGLFDMPVAGHVDGTDTARQTLAKELHEELGLNIDLDLQEVTELGHYNIAIPDFQPNYDEVEFTTLYRATLNPGAADKVRLQEEEVGGLILFTPDEQNRWISERPVQVGGGLIDSWKRFSDYLSQ